MDAGREQHRKWIVPAIVVVLAITHFVLAWTSTFEKSMTHDEILHLTGGTSYWRFDDYRLQPENGNLPQRLAGLPVAWSESFRFPDREQQAWNTSQVMVVGNEFCQDLGNDLEGMLLRGRAMIALLSTGLCLLAFVWSRGVFGTLGGLLSLVLCALSPTVLAHGRLMTSEMCNALFLALTVWSGWRTLQRITLGRVLVSALCAGGLLLSKMSGPLVLPMALWLVIARLVSRKPLTVALPGWSLELSGPGARLAAIFAVVLMHVVVTLTVVWGAYGFRYSAFADVKESQPRFNFHSGTLESVAEHAGAAGSVLRWCGEHELLPEAYLYGTGVVLAAQSRRAFLNGEHGAGWWWFFPYCLAVKTPLPLFGLILAAVAAWWLGRRRRAGTESTAPLWALLVVYWLAAISASLNIGHRHLLPTYAPMLVLAGGAASWFTMRSRAGSWVVGLLIALFVVESARAYPHYLAYFNQITGRDDAYRHLADSSLDWGQDLPGLAAWLKAREQSDERPVYFAYFGSDRPERFGIRSEFIPVARWLPRDRAHPSMGRLSGGLYCVAATALQSVYLDVPGRWNPEYEQDYRRLQTTLGTGQQTARSLLARFDHLRAARLMAFLRQREPIDRVGYSILIYDLSDEDVRRAQFGPVPEKFADYTGKR